MTRRSMFFATGIFSFLSFLRRAVFYAFFYIYLRVFLGLSNTLTALLGTMNLLTSTIGQLIIWGPRLNRNPTSAKKFVVRGEVGAALAYFIAFLGHRVIVDAESHIIAALFLVFVFSLLELLWSGSDLGIRIIQGEVTQGEARGRLTGIIDGMGLAGQIVGFLLSGILYDRGQGFYNGVIFYIVVFLILSCATVIQVTPIMLTANETPGEDQKYQPLLGGNAVRNVLRVPSFAAFIGILATLIIGLFASRQIFLFYAALNPSLGLTDQEISILLVVFSFWGGIFTPIGGRLSDKFGRLEIMMISSAIASLCFFLLSFPEAPNFLVVGAFYSALGISTALIQTLAFAFTADILPADLQGTGFSLYNITLGIGWGMAGFFVGGPIADSLIFLGTETALAYRIVLLISGMILILGTGALFVFNKRRDEIEAE
ncbi:MAG: MFS transporter [Candidatus Heimdallarchaeota archaeon]